MVWGAVAAVAGGAILQGLGNERSARAVRRNARRQSRYLQDYSDKKQKRNGALANSLSQIGDTYMEQVSRYYNARNTTDRSDKGRAAYESQQANTIDQAGEMLGDIGLDQSDEQKEYTKDLESANIQPYLDVMNIEAQQSEQRGLDEDSGMDLFQAGAEIEAGARDKREQFQLVDAKENLNYQNRMQEFAAANSDAERAGDTLTGIGGVLQAGGMVSAMF